MDCIVRKVVVDGSVRLHWTQNEIKK